MSIEDIIEDYKSKTVIRRDGKDAHLLIPFFQRYEFDSVAVKLYEEGNDLFISDCGGTFEHLTNRYVDPYEYRDVIERIKKRFCLFESPDHEFILRFPSGDLNSIEMFIGFFFQAISIIGNVDILG